MLHIAGDVVAGFVGGTVGVLGTILALEYKMKKVSREREGLEAHPRGGSLAPPY